MAGGANPVLRIAGFVKEQNALTLAIRLAKEHDTRESAQLIVEALKRGSSLGTLHLAHLRPAPPSTHPHWAASPLAVDKTVELIDSTRHLDLKGKRGLVSCFDPKQGMCAVSFALNAKIQAKRKVPPTMLREVDDPEPSAPQPPSAAPAPAPAPDAAEGAVAREQAEAALREACAAASGDTATDEETAASRLAMLKEAIRMHEGAAAMSALRAARELRERLLKQARDAAKEENKQKKAVKKKADAAAAAAAQEEAEATKAVLEEAQRAAEAARQLEETRAWEVEAAEAAEAADVVEAAEAAEVAQVAQVVEVRPGRAGKPRTPPCRR